MIKRTAPVGEAYSLAGLVMVVLLASQPAVAASGGSQTHASPTAKRVFFRPVTATARQTASLRWRPHRMVRQAAHGTRPAGRLAYPLGLPAPAPGTSFSIVPRGVPLNSDAMGRRFRPHDPATPSDETAKQLPAGGRDPGIAFPTGIDPAQTAVRADVICLHGDIQTLSLCVCGATLCSGAALPALRQLLASALTRGQPAPCRGHRARAMRCPGGRHRIETRFSMRSKVHVVILSGAMIIGCGFASGVAAQGFGPQWRPATEFGASPAGQLRARRVANVPSFRPRTARLAQRFAEVRRDARRPLYTEFDPAVAWQAPAPAYRGYPVPPVGPSPSYASPGWPMAPMWGANPFGVMSQTWPNPMQMFANQYAWRPVNEPWNAYPPVAYPPVAYPPVARRFEGLPPSQPLASSQAFEPAPVAGIPRAPAFERWRPVAPAAAPRFAYAPPGWARAAVPGYRAPMPPFGNRVAAAGPWQLRPVPGTFANPANTPGFRPANYGQSTRNAYLASESTAEQKRSTGLPGWVTTFDEGGASVCSWCSGS